MSSLKVNDLVRFARYCSVGLLTNAPLYVAFLVMVALGLHPVASSALCYCLAVTISYLLNRKWTFKSDAGHRRDILRYLLGHLAGVIFAAACINAFLNWFGPEIAQLITIGLTPVVIYSMLRVFRFGQKGL